MTLGNPDRPVGGLAVPRPHGVDLRPLGRADLAVAAALVGELYRLPATDAEAHRARFDALVNDVDASPFLATVGGEPAGLMLLWFRRRLNHATFEGWISELVVTERYRRRGIAPGEGVEIRPIRDDDGDFEATTRLLAELGRPPPTEEKMPALRRTYAMHVARSDTGSMLAFADGAPVGFVSLELRQPFFVTAPQAWIPDLLVTESARGRRIGAALLDAAFAESAKRGAYAVALESGSHRTVAHRLYTGAGMADSGTFWTLP
jgi:GNAT superfamily N-acetyltransferase